MPLRAFIPDIRGVWRRLGTVLMMLYPRRVATIKIPTRIKGDIATSNASYDLFSLNSISTRGIPWWKDSFYLLAGL